MKVSRVLLSNKIIKKIHKKENLQSLEYRVSKLQKEVLDLEISSIQAIYGIKIDKNNYKKYKLG